MAATAGIRIGDVGTYAWDSGWHILWADVPQTAALDWALQKAPDAKVGDGGGTVKEVKLEEGSVQGWTNKAFVVVAIDHINGCALSVYRHDRKWHLVQKKIE